MRAFSRTIVLGAIALATLGLAAGVWAYWSAGSSAGGAGQSAAATVNQGSTPTATFQGAHAVKVSWGASTLSNGQAVDGYRVTRYDAAGNTPHTTLSDCAGTVTGSSATLDCTENAVPAGTWKYTVTPLIGDHWRGQESLESGSVTVAGNASLTVSPTVVSGPFPQTITGSLNGFGAGEAIDYSLDSSTPLSGSPSSADGSGSASVSIDIPDAGDGPHTVHATGSVSQVSASILIDSHAPAVTATLTPAPNAAGWNNAFPVSVSLAADDGTGSGVQDIRYTTDGSNPKTSATAHSYSTPFDVSGEGTTTVRFYATDTAGNASAVETQLVKIDTADPTISASAKTADANAYTAGNWTNETVTVKYACADGGSGVADCTSDQTFGSDGVTASTSGTATDNVGNSANATFGPVRVDKTAPTITASAKNADNTTYTAGTWTRQTVTVHYTCSDPTANGASSGIASCPADQVFSSDGVTASTSGSATDNAGNSASASFGPVKVDKSGPVNVLSLVNQGTQSGPAGSINPTSFLSGSTLYYDGSAAGGRSFNIQNAVTDDGSGPASTTFGAFSGGGWTTLSQSTVSTPSGGPYVSSQFTWSSGASSTPSESVTGTDGAGNTTSSSLAFRSDTTNPTASIAFPATNGFYSTSSWNTASGCTTGTICGTAGDSGTTVSGVAKVQVSIQATSGANVNKYWDPAAGSFSSSSEVPMLASGTTNWSLDFPASNLSDAKYTVKAYAVDNVGNFASASSTGITFDSVEPSSSASLSQAPNAAGWNNASTLTVTLSATDATAGVASITYSATGANPIPQTTVNGTSTTITISSQGTTTLSYHATDKAGNVESPDNVQTVKYDKGAPVNNLSLVSKSGNPSFLSGSTLFYKGSSAGQFRFQNAVTDSVSGAASSLFGALGGTATGWSFNSSTVSSPAGGPYVSNLLSWAGGTTSSPTEVVTGADVAGNTLAGSTITFKNDVTAPTTTDNADTSWHSSPVTVTLTPTDGTGSGVAGTVNQVDGASQQSGTSILFGAPVDHSNDGAHTLSYFSTDNLGTAETAKTASVKIDTLAPGAAFSHPTNGASYLSSSAWPSGSFDGTSSDAMSGVSTVTLAVTRTFDNKCLDRGKTKWSNCPVNDATTGTTSWSAPVSYSLLTNGMSAGTTSSYTATITVTDVAGNTGTAVITFSAKA